jgi:arginyl-tRNA synthetase
MNLFSEFLAAIGSAVAAVAAEQGMAAPPDLSRVTAEPPRDPAHGDISTNAAMVLNKAFGKPPRVLAEAIAARLAGHPEVARSRSQGPASSTCG